MVTMGAVVSAPEPFPVTMLETVPPPAEMARVVLTVVVVVGVNRTFMAWLAPTPRVNGLPDTILKGAPTDAAPETVPPPVFDTVTVCSAKLPRFTLPKFIVPVGVTEKSARATALAMLEQALSLPPASMAVTATLYSVPVVSPASLWLTV
jgi:hypothetical protein